MENKKVKMKYEVLWDYDWILYEEYEDGTMKNIHSWIYFDKWIQRTSYSPLYQFKDWKLVWYSRHKAEWLSIDDDLNKPNNLLWWIRDDKLSITFKPIKDINISHIKAIISEWHTRNKEYLNAFMDRLTSIITIKK